MGEIDDCCSIQLINSNGEFNVEGLDHFLKKTKLPDCGLSYAVVAIMGPQSSGKSTLLNHLFKTSFREMDAAAGRDQTTKGIWIAKCVGIEPFTVAMDLEGTDGTERGEDDTTFEKQSALFALAVTDILLINMWCHDIGRENASNRPLLKTVFQTPMAKLEHRLRADIQKIWDLVRKPEAHKNTPLSEFFNVEIVALSNYEEKEKLFKEELAELRQRFFHSISPGGLAGDRRGVVPASGFSFSSRQIWKVIKENRDLDLPAHKVMVATVRCEQIANEKLQNLATDENLLELQEAVQSGPVPGFGKKLSSILEKYFSEYDAEAVYFEEGVRKEKRLQMKIKALDFVYSAYATMLGHLRSSALESFKIRLEQSLNQGEGFAKAVRDSQQSCLIVFDKGCEDATVEQATWDASKIREKLCRDIDSHTSSTQTAKLSELTANYEKRLVQALSGPVESLFETGGKETWPSIRKLLKRETETAVTDFLDVVTGFELDHATIDSMVQNLKDYSQGLVEKKARDEAAKILIRMKDRFSTVFSHDKDSMPRVWTGKEDIRAITKDARAEALSLLAVMAAIRLDERPDDVESTLFSSLMDGTVSVATSHNRSLGTSTDPLASSTWEEIPPKDVLLTPVQCKSLWRQFKSETEYTVTQAISAQEAHKRNNNWLPPAWAIVLMIVLGFNEFMMLLKNPLYLFGFFVAFLLSKALWVQLDIPREFQHGALAGVLSITSKLLPTVMNLLRKLAEEAQGKTTQEAPEYSASQSYKQQSPSHSISCTVAESVSSNISQMADHDAEYSSRPALVQRRNTRNVQESEISQI